MQKLAQKIIDIYKLLYPGCENFKCELGTSVSDNTGEASSANVSAYNTTTPYVINSVTSNNVPYAQSQLAANQATLPGYANLYTDLYKTYGPQLQSVASDITAQAQADQAASDLALLQGTGKDTINALVDVDKALNPEWYTARSATGNQLNNLVNSIDLSGLTPAEEETIRRANAQENVSRGTFATPNQTAAVGNAMNYGTGLSNKRTELANILNTSANVMPKLQSSYNAYNIGTGKSADTSVANSQFNTATSGNKYNSNELAGLTQSTLGSTTNTTNTAQNKALTESQDWSSWWEGAPC